MNDIQDTICAIATAQGGAIGIIRVSGSEAIAITDSIFTPAGTPTPLAGRKPYTQTFGHIKNDKGELVDEVLVSLFRAPHSYTGEDSTEISCHGSPYILSQVMQLLIAHGCRSAHPGEYTQRAYLNGKMDLCQAEAVADLIASTSAGQHRLALNQMRGGFSLELKELRDQLLHLTSLLELELDFSDHEDLEFADRSELQNLTSRIKGLISRLADSFSMGNAIKKGIPVAIIGETNAGKSTLLNALLNEDRAIVSDIHGTTRDIIEDTINISGITFRFIDTAGIRQTDNVIESLGIERSFRAVDKSQVVIIVHDKQQGESAFRNFYRKVEPHLKGKKIIIALNKCDISAASAFTPPQGTIIEISAKNRHNVTHLQDLLVQLASIPEIQTGDVIVTNIRHYEALTHALESISRVQKGLDTNMSGDLISQDLRECIFHLNDIVGEVTTDEVLGNIFKNFCIGK